MSVSLSSISINRRNFLLKSGWIAAGATVLSACSSILPVLPTLDDPELNDALSWIQILPDGRVLFYSPRMEMGQGAALGLCQVVAEELNVDQSEIECLVPNTDQVPPFKMTVGSEGIASYFKPVAFGAATLREKLKSIAAERYEVSIDQIRSIDKGFLLPNGASLTYGGLVQQSPLIVMADDPVNENALLKYNISNPKAEHQAIGKSWKDPDLEAIVRGELVYSRDVEIPDMLYGKVVHQPAYDAKIESFDFSIASKIPGVVDIVIDEETDLIGVVAEDPFTLRLAMDALKVKWEISQDQNHNDFTEQLDVEKAQADNALEHELLIAGDLAAGKNISKHQMSARYDTSYAAHAAIEPRAAVAWVRGDKIEIWCGSQDPYFVKSRVAHVLGRNSDDIVVYPHRLGGGFGGRVRCQASEEAALLSTRVGRPVKVQWDRQTEFQNNYFQPPFSHHIYAGVTSAGLISHWEHDFVSSPIITGIAPKHIAWVLDMVAADKGTARGGLSHYKIDNQRVRYSDIRTNIPIGAWRGLGAAPNTFAIETMIDELAAKAGIDPLKFRLNNLPVENDRLAAVLTAASEMAGWGEPCAQNEGLGIACAMYKGETAVGVVAKVKIDKEFEKIQVLHIWCAQDCGLVINPDQVENQIMGNIVWGCGMALMEKITFNKGEAEAKNFDDYKILRHSETPNISIKLINPKNLPPSAVGESAFGPVAPAITNAIFAASGHRQRALPMKYALVGSSIDN